MSNKRCLPILIAFLFCFLVFNVAAAEGQRGVTTDSELAGMHDIAATGEFEGYRKLVGHNLEKYYAAYFTYQVNGTAISYHIATVPLNVLDMNERITMALPNGEEQTATRETWYKVFRSARPDRFFTNYLQRNYTQLYNEWAIYDSGIELEHIVARYIEKAYSPKPEKNYPVLLPDSKVQ